MRKLALTFTLTLVACSSIQKERAVQYVVSTDAAADQVAVAWPAYVDSEIERCRDELAGTERDNPQGRRECLGIAAKGDGLEVAVKALIVAQQAVEVAVQCEENPLKVPQEFAMECVAPVDWEQLATDVKKAWNGFKPYWEAVNKR